MSMFLRRTSTTNGDTTRALLTKGINRRLVRFHLVNLVLNLVLKRIRIKKYNLFHTNSRRHMMTSRQRRTIFRARTRIIHTDNRVIVMRARATLLVHSKADKLRPIVRIRIRVNSFVRTNMRFTNSRRVLHMRTFQRSRTIP